MSLLTVADIADYLSVDVTKGVNTTARLQAAIDDATAALERRVGPMTVQTFTDRVHGNGTSLVLPRTPVVALTTIIPTGGVTLDVTKYDINATAGIISLPLPYFAARLWTFPAAYYDVTYTAGRATVTNDLLRGLRELIRHYWGYYRGGDSVRNGSQGEPQRMLRKDAQIVWPASVLELIEPEQITAFA